MVRYLKIYDNSGNVSGETSAELRIEKIRGHWCVCVCVCVCVWKNENSDNVIHERVAFPSVFLSCPRYFRLLSRPRDFAG